MTSRHKQESNRRNAEASSGPKSAAGKARSSRNALRHGLAIPIWADRALAAEAEALARQMAGANASREVLGLARAVADAQTDVLRIRRARRDLLAGAACDLKAKSQVALQLGAIDRYENRALSRRNRAIRAFDCARLLHDEMCARAASSSGRVSPSHVLN